MACDLPNIRLAAGTHVALDYRGDITMQLEGVQDIENYWIDVVESTFNADNDALIVRVPLDCINRQAAAKLAARLHIWSLSKGLIICSQLVCKNYCRPTKTYRN